MKSSRIPPQMLLFTLSALALGACKSASEKSARPPESVDPMGAVAVTQTAPPTKAPAAVVPAPKKIEDPVTYCAQGRCKPIERSDAVKRGLSIIDLSDEYAPYIFSERSEPGEPKQVNTYRKIFIDLANDRTDEEGTKLKKGEHNYLELFGIPPTLSVIQKRFLTTAAEPCAAPAQSEIFSKLAYSLVYDGMRPRKYYHRFKAAQREFQRWARSRRIKDTDAYLASHKGKKAPRAVRSFRRAQMQYHALLALQKRLVCEHILMPRDIRKDAFDAKLKRAIRMYERKHMIFGWGYLNEKLRKHLAGSMRHNDFLALRRMVRERVAHSLAIFEDGTVSSDGRLGKKARKNDLIGRMTGIVMAEAGIDTEEKALAFFKRFHSSDFSRYEVAVKLPALPEYYGKSMEFFVRHSVGDLWYDVPYTPQGQRRSQPRSILPSVTVYVVYNGRQIPLTRMGTTAGGWQEEFVENQIYLKYKGSDLGPKEWKFIVGAPVWFPPPTTPPRDLITYTTVRGRLRAVVKRQGLGPSYASAYGLAMALHTFSKRSRGRILDLDQGIRTHGSVNYMSIRIGHSHGCHRLHNHIALRLFSNLLRRHPHKRLGQQKADWSHFFVAGGRTHKIHLDTKGYYYEMTPPIPIRVTRGNLLGTQKMPIKELIRIPGKKYKTDTELGMEISPDGSLQPAGTADATTTDATQIPSALPDKPDTTGTGADPAKPGTRPAKPGMMTAPIPDSMVPAKPLPKKTTPARRAKTPGTRAATVPARTGPKSKKRP